MNQERSEIAKSMEVEVGRNHVRKWMSGPKIRGSHAHKHTMHWTCASVFSFLLAFPWLFLFLVVPVFLKFSVPHVCFLLH